MAKCKHDLTMLEGRADGIHCRSCGRVFKNWDELQAEIKPKKEDKKNARK